MAIALDLAIVLIIGITFAVVLCRGFIKTILDFTSVIFAIVFAKMFSAPLSNMFYKPFYGSFSKTIGEVVDNFWESDNLPAFLEQDNIFLLLEKYNVGLAEIISKNNIDNGVQVIVESIIGLLSYAVAFLLIFILTIIIFKVLSIVLNGVFKLPGLKTINKTLSMILAVIICLVYVSLFAAFMQIVVPVVSSMYPEILNTVIIDSTYLFKYFYNFEWIKFFVN